MAPHKPFPARAEKPVKSPMVAPQRSVMGALWMTDANFTPSFPEYVSGHSTYSAAAARVLEL